MATATTSADKISSLSSSDSDSDSNIEDTYPTLFVRVKDLPSFGTPIWGIEIYDAVESVTGERDRSECIQKSDGLWRITLKCSHSRLTLLSTGLNIRGHHVTVLSKNPNLINGQESVRLSISNLPYSVSNETIKKTLKNLGVTFGRDLEWDLYHKDRKVTACKTGKRFAWIAPPKIPLPKHFKVAGKFHGFLSYKGQDDSPPYAAPGYRKQVFSSDTRSHDPLPSSHQNTEDFQTVKKGKNSTTSVSKEKIKKTSSYRNRFALDSAYEQDTDEDEIPTQDIKSTLPLPVRETSTSPDWWKGDGADVLNPEDLNDINPPADMLTLSQVISDTAQSSSQAAAAEDSLFDNIIVPGKEKRTDAGNIAWTIPAPSDVVTQHTKKQKRNDSKKISLIEKKQQTLDDMSSRGRPSVRTPHTPNSARSSSKRRTDSTVSSLNKKRRSRSRAQSRSKASSVSNSAAIAKTIVNITSGDKTAKSDTTVVTDRTDKTANSDKSVVTDRTESPI